MPRGSDDLGSCWRVWRLIISASLPARVSARSSLRTARQRMAGLRASYFNPEPLLDSLACGAQSSFTIPIGPVMMLMAYSGLGHIGEHMRKLVVVFALVFSGEANAQEMTPLGKPTPSAQRAATKPKPTSDEAELARLKARNEARQKAWDEKTKRAMGGICLGC